MSDKAMYPTKIIRDNLGRFVKGGPGFVGRRASPLAKEKMRQAKLRTPTRYWLGKKRPHLSGKNNPQWKDKAGYTSLHQWVVRHRGRPSKCELCGRIDAKKYEWANLSGKYKRDLLDWTRLCTSCHQKKDGHGQSNLVKFNRGPVIFNRWTDRWQERRRPYEQVASL